MRLIREKTERMEEGILFNKWLDNRFKHNKNILIATTGPTGSGKSYTNLRQAELWYKYKFNKKFPVETHCCFSVGEVIKLLNSKRLQKGEIIILEEAGVNLGNLDFQNRLSKLFSYVLQSFRSMNIGILFNLPILTLLNKTARFLLHGQFVTGGINFQTKKIKIKPLFHQVNQYKGKIYQKYLRIKVGNRSVTVKRFNYSLPSDEIIKEYENKKQKFVAGLTDDFSKELDELDKDNLRKLGRKSLSEIQQEYYNDLVEGLTAKDLAKKYERSLASVYDVIKCIKKKGFVVKLHKKA